MCQSCRRFTRTSRSAIVVCLGLICLSADTLSAQHGQAPSANITTQPSTLPAATPLPPNRLFALASPGVVTVTIKDEDGRAIGNASGFVVAIEKEERTRLNIKFAWPAPQDLIQAL